MNQIFDDRARYQNLFDAENNRRRSGQPYNEKLLNIYRTKLKETKAKCQILSKEKEENK